MERKRRFSLLAHAVLVVVLGLAWCPVAFVQGAEAWGLVGMPKPWSFIALSWAVWIGWPIVGAILLIALVFRGVAAVVRRVRQNTSE